MQTWGISTRTLSNYRRSECCLKECPTFFIEEGGGRLVWPPGTGKEINGLWQHHLQCYSLKSISHREFFFKKGSLYSLRHWDGSALRWKEGERWSDETKSRAISYLTSTVIYSRPLKPVAAAWLLLWTYCIVSNAPMLPQGSTLPLFQLHHVFNGV